MKVFIAPDVVRAFVPGRFENEFQLFTKVNVSILISCGSSPSSRSLLHIVSSSPPQQIEKPGRLALVVVTLNRILVSSSGILNCSPNGCYSNSSSESNPPNRLLRAYSPYMASSCRNFQSPEFKICSGRSFSHPRANCSCLSVGIFTLFS